MTTSPTEPSVALSSAEPLRDQENDTRFPYAAAYASFAVVSLLLLGIPELALRLSSLSATWFNWILQFGVFLPVLFFIFRWSINSRILDSGVQLSDAWFKYEKRLSFKNPFLAGLIAYLVINELASTAVDPLQKLVASGSVLAKFVFGTLITVVVGYFAYRLAVKHVVLKPYSGKRLWPMLGLIFVLSILSAVAISLAEVRQEWAFRNHVYCEVLHPGMTQSEVTTALSEYGARGQIPWEYNIDGPGTEKAVSFTEPYFHDYEIEYRLNLILGYDVNKRLVAVGHKDLIYTSSVIECPLPFR